jgi:polar amino acid transport system ATP-binding protein
MIEIENVHKHFSTLHVLKGVSLSVNKGEVLSMIGGSGSGKSTMLMCINGLEPIQDGRITVDNVDVHAKATNLNQLRQRIGIVFQQWNAFPHLTVLENVMLAPRKVLGKSKAEAEAIAVEQLKHVGLGEKLKAFPSRLSGGQQQRMAIARALAMSPDYMLFDEVTSALDPQLVGEVLDTLRMRYPIGWHFSVKGSFMSWVRLSRYSTARSAPRRLISCAQSFEHASVLISL